MTTPLRTVRKIVFQRRKSRQLRRERREWLCLGHEDLDDHDELCRDRLMALVCESDDVMGEHRRRESDRGKPLAGKSTLNRLELSPVQDKAPVRQED